MYMYMLLLKCSLVSQPIVVLIPASRSQYRQSPSTLMMVTMVTNYKVFAYALGEFSDTVSFHSLLIWSGNLWTCLLLLLAAINTCSTCIFWAEHNNYRRCMDWDQRPRRQVVAFRDHFKYLSCLFCSCYLKFKSCTSLYMSVSVESWCFLTFYHRYVAAGCCLNIKHVQANRNRPK